MTEFEKWLFAKFSDANMRREQMHPYQKTAYWHLYENPYSALFIDMGLGKTVTAATLVVDLLNDFESEKVLIIGPLRVATETWPTEFRKWQHTASHNVEVIYADEDDPRIAAAGRQAAAEARAKGVAASEANKVRGKAETVAKEAIRKVQARSKKSIHIIPADWVEWLVEFHHHDWPYDTVIIDESSGFKDHGSGRFKALKKVRDATRKGVPLIRRLHCLTATPAAESYIHLFAQVYLMDGGKRFGKSITHYRDEYFNYNRYSQKYKLREGSEDKILEKINDICLVMKQEDYLDMEKPIFVVRDIIMRPAEKALYDEMEREMIVTLPDGSEIEAETAAALSAKLLQMASGVLYETQLLPGQTEFDDHIKIKKVHSIHNHKIDMLKQIVAESQGQPLLVGYHHRASLDRLKKEFPNAVVMDRAGKCIKAWNAGKIPMLLMHPQSGGHGLNLQEGGHHIIFFDLPWSLELYLQFIGRLARQGQKSQVIVQLLIAKGTLDEAVYAALQLKEEGQEMMFKILKKLRAKMKRMADKLIKQFSEDCALADEES